VWAWPAKKSASLPDGKITRAASPVRDHAETLSGISLKRCPPSFEMLSAIA